MEKDSNEQNISKLCNSGFRVIGSILNQLLNLNLDAVIFALILKLHAIDACCICKTLAIFDSLIFSGYI